MRIPWLSRLMQNSVFQARANDHFVDSGFFQIVMNNLWLIIIGMGLVTFGIRLVPIVLLGRIEIPLIVQRALRFVPPAVLTAIVVPELLYRNDQIDVSLTNARLLAGLIAIVVAWRTKNALITIGAGMIALWVLQAVIGR